MVEERKGRVQPLRHFCTGFPPCLLHLLESEIRPNHVPKNTEKAFHVICCTASGMLQKYAIVSVELPPPLSPFSISYQGMHSLLGKATYPMNWSEEEIAIIFIVIQC